MIRQQTERAMALAAIPARNPCPRRIHPGVGAVAGKPAAAFRVEGATRQSCAAPPLQANVIAAGVPRVESKLHRQPARVGGDLRGPSSFDDNRPERSACGRAAEAPVRGAGVDSLWTSYGPCGQRNPALPTLAHSLPTPAPNIRVAWLNAPFGPDALRLPRSLFD